MLSNVSEKTVAVLPFESLSEDKGNAYFAGGVRDEILTKLAQVRGLKVMSRSSTKKNASHPTNLPELGRQLGTDSFLEGSVRNVAGDLSIHVQLMDAKTGTQLWAQSYQRPAKDISEVEGEVAHQVADALKVKLAPGEAQRLRLAATNNPRAHDSYLRARALSANSDQKSHEEQIALLREAVAEDPHYAVAWAELTGAYIHIGDVYRAPREILTPARDAAEKAVALDEKLATGHMLLAGIALTYDWNFPLAKREFERAIALDPDSSDAHRLYGWYLARAERNFVAARQEMAQARALDPLYTWPLWAESSVAIAQGDYESALAVGGARHRDQPRVSLRRRSDCACLCRDGAVAGWGEALRIDSCRQDSTARISSWRSVTRTPARSRAPETSSRSSKNLRNNVTWITPISPPSMRPWAIITARSPRSIRRSRIAPPEFMRRAFIPGWFRCVRILDSSSWKTRSPVLSSRSRRKSPRDHSTKASRCFHSTT